MAKPPPGAMSSPWGENGEMSQMLKDTSYFKDAQFNTDGKKSEMPPTLQPPSPPSTGTSVPVGVSPFKAAETKFSGKAFDTVTKKAIINLLMDNNIDAVNITESDITFKYKDGLFKVTMV